MSYPQPQGEAPRPTGNQPSFDVVAMRSYVARDGAERTNFCRIGAAWKREKGGYCLRLDALPLSETIFLFERNELPREGAA